MLFIEWVFDTRTALFCCSFHHLYSSLLFLGRSEMVSEVTNLCVEILDPSNSTNFKQGLLTCILEVLQLFKNERFEDFSSNSEILKSVVKDVDNRLNTGCFVLRTQLHEIGKLVGVEASQVAEENSDCAKHHPGFFEWRMLHNRSQINFETLDDDDDFIMKSREEGFKIIRQLTDSENSLPPVKAVYLLNRQVFNLVSFQALEAIT